MAKLLVTGVQEYDGLHGYILLPKRQRKIGFRLLNKISTQPAQAGTSPGIFSLSCEGINHEVFRVSVLDLRSKVVYDKLVVKNGEKNDKSEREEVSLSNAQEFFKHTVFCDSILIGIGMQKNMTLLEMSHDFIVDLSYVFTSGYRGLSQKGLLKMVSKKHLKVKLSDDPLSNPAVAEICMKIMMNRAAKKFKSMFSKRFGTLVSGLHGIKMEDRMKQTKKKDSDKLQRKDAVDAVTGRYVWRGLDLPTTGVQTYDRMRKYISVPKQLQKLGFPVNEIGYVTLPSSSDRYPGVFALDCEMVTTIFGQELARISIVDTEFNVIYDKFVQPEGRVVSYNTEYSGITENMLERATATIEDVHDFMKTRFTSDTILVGHDLRNDFEALKLSHQTVADSSIVFTHPGGFPNKYSLKDLAKSQLKKDIQQGHHDSIEDATTCMEIFMKKVKK